MFEIVLIVSFLELRRYELHRDIASAELALSASWQADRQAGSTPTHVSKLAGKEAGRQER